MKSLKKLLSFFLCLAMLVSIGTVAAVSHTGIAMTYTERLLECPYAEEGAEPDRRKHGGRQPFPALQREEGAHGREHSDHEDHGQT